MELKQITYEAAKKLTMPDFQRVQDKARVNELRDYFIEKGKYDSMPILVNQRGEVIDGGHRLNGFIKAFEEGKIDDKIYVLVDMEANKDTFLAVNKGRAVSISHKIKIHDKIKHLKEIGYRFSDISTSKSLSYVDFARALALQIRYLNNQPVIQAKQLEINKILDDIEIKDLKRFAVTILEVHNKYFSLCYGKKFNQKVFLYIYWTFIKFGLSDNDIERIIKSYSSSLGGDIGTTFNKQTFLDILNYRKRINTIKLEEF